jgi:hypothetical protein
MTGRLHDDRLWDLPRVESHDDGPAPPDDLLAAYRAGALLPVDATRVEWRLAGSRHGRERLAALAGIRLDLPPARRSPWMKVAAALLAAAATFAIAALLFLGRARPLPEFSIRVEGLAAMRGVPGEARAYAGERVRIVVEPRGEAVANLTFAAYRLDTVGLTRLDAPREIAIEISRGSASLTAEAERLVGRAEGTRPFFVVVTDRAALPDHVHAREDGAESALAQAAGGRVYRVPLTIVASTEGAP